MKTALKPILLKILLSLGSLVFFFAAAEMVVRVLGEQDASGNFYFKNRIIHPHRMPLKMVADRARALQESDDSIVTYHQVLGWAPRADAESADGMYRYNSQGIRSPVPAYDDRPAAGVFRIALFGDSFTHGDDVPHEHSFGAVLEQELNSAGIAAEVLNFGVGGYGIDQAMLRFKQQGAAFAPDLVVLGFQPENLKRNLNLVRPLYDPRSGLPFSKPRFILTEHGLSLINVPALPPERLADTLRDFEAWELRPHEHFYDPADFQSSWWQGSRLLATVVDLKTDPRNEWLLKRIIFRERSEEQQLGWSVIQAFGQEAAAAGSRFLIVHLPSHPEMELHAGLGRWTYQTFLDALDGEFDVVHPEAALIRAAGDGGFGEIFAGHYNEKGNRIIAEALFTHLTE
ncbi:MAG: SGNH/GDSL hydrolase family protein [Candidatus Krumholzibacteriota bacterium]